MSNLSMAEAVAPAANEKAFRFKKNWKYKINGFAVRILCGKGKFSVQGVIESIAQKHKCIDFELERIGSRVYALIEFKSRGEVQTYLNVIKPLLEDEWSLEEKVYVRVNNGEYRDVWSDAELRIQFNLQANLGGMTEVKTPLGRIDLLTKTELIEIKPFKDWKAAIGQALVYGSFYPQHRKRIHLFDRKEQPNLHIIQSSCLSYDIDVTFEIDKGWKTE